jgi:hypothetical protein
MAPADFEARAAKLRTSSTDQEATDARDGENGQRLWQVALLAMAAALVAESLMGRRLG